MTRAAGIELTEDAIRLALVECAAKRTRVLDYAAAAIPRDEAKPWKERAADALRELVKGRKIPADRCACSIDTGNAILGEVHTPFTDDAQIARTAKFEMENLIPDHPIEDFVVDFYKSRVGEKETFLLGAALPKHAIRDHLDAMTPLHIEPSSLDLDICAAINALIAADVVDGNHDLLILIHGNTKFTKFALIENKRLISLRTMRFSIVFDGEKPAAPETAGTESPIVVISNDESRSFHRLDFATQKTLIKILARELARFTMSATSSTAPTKIVLSGIYDDPATVEMLRPETEIPVAAAGFDGKFAWTPGVAASRDSAAAIGLALKAAGTDALGMDFRREEFAYRKRFDRIKAGLVSTLLIVNVLLGMIFLKFLGDRDQFVADHGEILNQQEKVFRSVFEKERIDDRERIFAQMDDLHRQESARIGGGEYPIEVSSLVVWRDLFDVLATFGRESQNQKFLDEDLFVALEKIDINQDKKEMSLSGTAVNVNCAEALSAAIARKPVFKNVQLGSTQPTKDNKISFKLTATLDPKGETP